MAPKKRAASSGGKKSSHPNRGEHPSQPSKYGIQHFFQNTNSKRNDDCTLKPIPDPSTATNPRDVPPQVYVANRDVGGAAARGEIVVISKLEKIESMGEYLRRGQSSINNAVNSIESAECSRNDVKNCGDGFEFGDLKHCCKKGQNLEGAEAFEVTPTAENQSEVSPEASKPVKRLKFSPGMLIKQSQDDITDEITWKISPVNERLHALSKHLPGRIRVLADSTRFNSMNFQQCSQKKLQTSPVMSRKLEKWLASPPPKADKKSVICSDGPASRKVNSGHDLTSHENSININSSAKFNALNTQSPFSTPPSLSFCLDKALGNMDSSRVPDQLGSRQHKKALIELLDQVEDVISVEHSSCKDNETSLDAERSPKADFVVNHLTRNSEEPKCSNNAISNFLVLEVSEKHGAVEPSAPPSSYKVLRLLDEESGAEKALQLWDEWYFSAVSPGDTVHVIGEFDNQVKCDVNREKSFLIVHPDVLVSGSRVSASFSCPRRTVLDERLKHSEHSSAALMGTLLHQIFQAGLITESPTKKFLEDYSRSVLQKSLESLYACGANENDTWKTLIEAIPRILNWISSFRDSQGSKSPSIDFKCDEGLKNMKISEVIDIEEMAWAPKYGLKGMIDASLRVKTNTNSSEASEIIMPLEFKTGKATSGQAAIEHSAQVMLYTLLMSERYMENIECGLLYYLHTDQTQGISVRRSDLIGLIMRRNELANDLLKASRTQQLPPMLQTPNMCRSCRHLSVCTIYHKAYGGNTEGSGLGDIYDSLVSHLTTTHTLFLQKWERLIDLEAKHLEVVKKERWGSDNSRNDHNPIGLSSLVLDASDKLSQKNDFRGDRFIYRFVRRESPLLDTEQPNGGFSSSSSSLEYMFRNGDCVVLSTEPGHLRVANGVIVDIGNSHVSVSFAKRLRLPGHGPVSMAEYLLQQSWRIDKDEVMASFGIMRYNLVQLFLQNEDSSRLRKMLVDLEMPRFDSGCLFSQDPAISYVWSERSLNDDQRRAILKILTAKDYTLILGMPGTGKTSTLVHAVKALLMRDASILLTSYTNSAVDNLLIKLKAQGIDFIRIGRHEAVHEKVRENCLSVMDMNSTQEIKEKLDKISVVAVTCLGITSPLLTNKRFDICIMDEAGQITLPVSLGPLMFASKFVLVGDHYQLPPLVQSPEAKENGMSVSLFCKLTEAHPQAIAALHSQVLNPNQPVVFINTDLLPAYETNDRKALNNPTEAYIIAEITKTLLLRGIEGQDIGIITPYNSQANLIRGAVSEPVEIHTIDKYQGRDKECILVSFVRSCENPRSASSLLGDWHRINVALTRAKKKLIMVGSCATLSKVPLLKLLVEKVEDLSGMLVVSKKDIGPQFELKRCSQLN